MKKSKYGNGDIATELDTFIRTSVINGIPTKDWLKSTKTELSKIVKAYFPSKTHQTFVEVWVVENHFYSLIGFRPLSEKKFGFINCNVGFKNNDTAEQN